jgi:hypothetical protein
LTEIIREIEAGESRVRATHEEGPTHYEFLAGRPSHTALPGIQQVVQQRDGGPPAVPRVLLVESEDHPGPLGEQIPTVAGDLAELGQRGRDVERWRLAWRDAVPAISALMMPSRFDLRRGMAMLGPYRESNRCSTPAY